jgi:hypothetical protein
MITLSNSSDGKSPVSSEQIIFVSCFPTYTRFVSFIYSYFLTSLLVNRSGTPYESYFDYPVELDKHTPIKKY